MDAEPIFLLACGPRSGSTWLQRVFTAHGALIWGEHSYIDFIHGNASRWAQAEEPGLTWNLARFREAGPAMWMAVMLPNRAAQARGLRALLRSALGESAEAEGYRRWGLKETFWTPEGADLLREAFPEARTVFLARRFLEAYRSRFSASYSLPQDGSANLHGCRHLLADEREDRETFCRRWLMLTEYALGREGAVLARYEELLVPGAVERLCGALGLPKTSRWRQKVGGRIGQSEYRPLEPEDMAVIERYWPEIRERECQLRR